MKKTIIILEEVRKENAPVYLKIDINGKVTKVMAEALLKEAFRTLKVDKILNIEILK